LNLGLTNENFAIKILPGLISGSKWKVCETIKLSWPRQKVRLCCVRCLLSVIYLHMILITLSRKK